MTDSLQTSRQIKGEVCRLLDCGDVDAEGDWARLPAHKTVNALFRFLYSPDPRLKWCAVQAMGKAVARLAHEDLEAARNVIRRLMWSLNDESGGIGWGAGEAMGEILARHQGLAREYAHILLSYARHDGNLLDNDGLLQGVLWGLVRVAKARRELLQNSAKHIVEHLQSSSPGVRALAVELLGLLGDPAVRHQLEDLAGDLSEVALFLGDCAKPVRISDLVVQACDRLEQATGTAVMWE